MNILIIDDNKQDIATLKNLLKEIEQKEHIHIVVQVSDLLPCYSKEIREFDMIFLNPVVNGASSIDLACEIRKYDRNVVIVFTADNLDYVLQGYHANANRYLLKPYDKESFFKEITELFWHFIYVHKSIRISKNSPFNIPINKILYIQVQHRRTNLYLVNGEKMESYHPLTDWIKLLEDAPFSRPCRAFYINFIHAIHIDQYGMKMRDNKWIPISKSYQEPFLSDYIVYRNRRIMK